MEAKSDGGVLLLNAPFGSLKTPYLAVPTLTAYLKSKGIPVRAFDLNRELWRRFLTAGNIREGLEYCNKRFFSLNTQQELLFAERIEYLRLIQLLSESNCCADFLDDFFKEEDFTKIQHYGLNSLLIDLAVAPHFPNIFVARPFNRFCSRFSIFSSRDLLAGSKHGFFYTKTVERILRELIENAPPRMVGISVVYDDQALAAFQVARLMKQIAPTVHVTIGGPFITQHMRNLRNARLFDIADSFVLDEGEIPLETLHNELARDKPDLSRVPNLVWRDGTEIICNPTTPPPDLEKAPAPDYSSHDLDSYLLPLEQLKICFRLSSGCSWHRCSFCRTDMSFCRNDCQPAPEALYRQFRMVLEQTRARTYIFSDESARPDVLEYISEQLLKDDVHVDWYAVARVQKALTLERAQLFKKAGCKGIFLGVECFNDRVLHLMNKGTSVKLIHEVLEQVNGAAPLFADMMCGFPTETEQEAQDSYRQLREYLKRGWLKGYYYALFFILFGSDIWRNPARYTIADMNVPSDWDLEPDIGDFRAMGLDRKTACALVGRFNAGQWGDTPRPKLTDIRLDGRTFKLNFDLDETYGEVERVAHLSCFHPYGKWLEMQG